MRILAGTSGFAYKEWKGSFYPADLKNAAMLSYYAERLPAVEINNTFYRMPKAEGLAAWAAEVPPGFRFVLKAPQRITHFKRLKETAQDVAFLCEQSAILGERRGPFLVQLPPNMKIEIDRLRAFLADLPAGARVALEVRHESWLTDAVYDALREKDAALCIADTDEMSTPLVPTASWGYLRLRRVVYEDAEVAEWAAKARAQPWTEAYAFFKHEDGATGPRLAGRFLELASA